MKKYQVLRKTESQEFYGKGMKSFREKILKIFVFSDTVLWESYREYSLRYHSKSHY